MTKIRCFVIILAFVGSASFCPYGGRTAHADLVIILNNTGGSAPTTTGTGSLASVMGAAAGVWELAFNDSSFDHTLTIDFQWQGISGSTLAFHSLDGQGGTPNRETSAFIRFDGDGSSNYFLDGSLNPLDPINNGNDEYTTYTETSQNFGGGSLNKGRIFTGATGAAAGRFDLFSVALHEIGHALGMSSANTSYQNETWPDNVIDVTSGPFAGSQLPTNNNGVLGDSGFFSNAHLNIGTSLLFPSISSGIRRLPTAADILANSQISQFGNPNLNLSPVPEPNSLMLFGWCCALGISRRRRKAA